MIMHFSLGNTPVNPNSVEVQNVPNQADKKKTIKFIHIKDIKQKLKVNAKFLEDRGLTTDDLYIESVLSTDEAGETWTAGIVTFDKSKFNENEDPNKRLRWVNHSKTFSPMLLGGKYDADEDVIIYISLPTSYKILGYYSALSLLQTYFVKDVCNGCVLIAKKSVIENLNAPVFNCTFYDYNDKKLKTVVIGDIFNANFVGTVKFGPIPKTKFKSVVEKNKKYKQSMRFKIRSVEGKMLTSAFITSAEYSDELNAILKAKGKENKCTNKPVVFIINDNAIEDALDFATNDNYKAVTLYNVDIPREMFKERKIYNVFIYDKENDIVVNI